MTKAEYNRAWEKTPAGKEARRRYEQSAKGKAGRHRRKVSAAYKEGAREWGQTESGKRSRRRAGQKYQVSEKGKATAERYTRSAGGKESLRHNKSLRRARERRVAKTERIDRAKVFARDAGTCQECFTILVVDGWELDHVVPLGPGSHTYDNIRAVCPTCNRRKIARDKEVLALWRG